MVSYLDRSVLNRRNYRALVLRRALCDDGRDERRFPCAWWAGDRLQVVTKRLQCRQLSRVQVITARRIGRAPAVGSGQTHAGRRRGDGAKQRAGPALQSDQRRRVQCGDRITHESQIEEDVRLVVGQPRSPARFDVAFRISMPHRRKGAGGLLADGRIGVTLPFPRVDGYLQRCATNCADLSVRLVFEAPAHDQHATMHDATVIVLWKWRP